MKKGLPSAFFILTFVPAWLILGRSVIAYFDGFGDAGFFGSPSYGRQGFVDSLAVWGYVLAVGIPVLPVCLICQIFYICNAAARGKSLKNELRLIALITVGAVIIPFIFGAAFPFSLLFPPVLIALIAVRAYIKPKKEPDYMMMSGDEVIEYQSPSTGRRIRILVLYAAAAVYIIDTVDNKLLLGTALEHADRDSEKLRYITNSFSVQSAFPLTDGRQLITYYKTDPAVTSAVVILRSDNEAFCSLSKSAETGLDMPEYTKDKKQAVRL